MIYLDYAATTPIDLEVLDTYTSALKNSFANPASKHTLGLNANALYINTKKLIAKELGFTYKEGSLVLTGSATEANNLMIFGLLGNKKKEIISTMIEHPSVLECLKKLENEGYIVHYVNLDRFGKIDIEDLKKYLNVNTLMLITSLVNNENGVMQDQNVLFDLLVKNNSYLVLDCVQGFGKVPVNFQKLHLASLSAHKIYGPKGLGLLINPTNLKINPITLGGNQENGVRSGTPNYPSAQAFLKAITLVKSVDKVHVENLYNHLYNYLSSNSNVILNSTLGNSCFILNFSLKYHSGEVVFNALNAKGIEVSTTSACASKKSSHSYVIFAITKNAELSQNVIRISLSHLTTFDEINYLISCLDDIFANTLRKKA
jgi:cysteine desulfurase